MFATTAAEFKLGRHRNSKFNHLMVEEWLSTFEGMGHGGDINLGQQIAGQVRLQVRRGRSRDGITIGHVPPRLAEEGRRL